MDGDEKAGDNEETVLKFGFLIQKFISKDKVVINVASKNKGMQDSEVILIMEAWLEEVKKRFKKGITDNMSFSDE